MVSNAANDIRKKPKDGEAHAQVREAITRLRAAIEDQKSRVPLALVHDARYIAPSG
jgi:hypothetical protein